MVGKNEGELHALLLGGIGEAAQLGSDLASPRPSMSLTGDPWIACGGEVRRGQGGRTGVRVWTV